MLKHKVVTYVTIRFAIKNKNVKYNTQDLNSQAAIIYFHYYLYYTQRKLLNG